MGQAEEIYAREFDQILLNLSQGVRAQIQSKITELGQKLEHFPHYRMKGREEFRLRVGDYRVIYKIDLNKNQIYLITLGHRREVYR